MSSNMKMYLIQKWKNLKDKFDYEMLCDNIHQFEKQCVDLFIISYSSFQDYHVRNSPPPRSRVIKAWLSVTYLWLITFMCGILAYKNHPDLFRFFGFPLIAIERRREIMIIFMFGFLIAAYGKTLTLILERKTNFEMINIALSIKKRWRGNLMPKNVRILTILSQLYIKLAYPLIIYPCNLIVASAFLILSLIPFLNNDNSQIETQFSYMQIPCFFLFNYSIWYLFNFYYCSIAGYVFSTIYIVLRFNQVRDRIKKSRSNVMLIYCLRDHNEICLINERNNLLLSHMMFIMYFFISIIVDLDMYLAINMNAFAFRITFTFIAMIAGCILFLMSIPSAYLSTSAHSPYKKLNTIMMTRTLTPAVKFKLLNLIERLGGPDISNYVLDLFPVNMFTFYLLVCDVAKNFIIILDLFSK